MKKRLLASALVVAFSGAVHAKTYTVSSNITGVQFYLNSSEVLTNEPGGYFNNFRISGTAVDVDDDGVIDSSDVAMTGEASFSVFGVPARLTIDFQDGQYTAGMGTTFTSGWLQMDAYFSSWTPYSSIDVAATNLEFLAGRPGHFPQWGPQTTAGLLLAPGTQALPGLWDGIDWNSEGFNSAVGVMPIAGFDIGFFLDGTVTLTEVPVPGAAWLFVSGLAGLGVVSRRRVGNR